MTEDDALGSRVLSSQITQFLNESFDLCRRPPLIEIKSTEDTLTNLNLLFELQRRSFKVDREWQMTNWASRLYSFDENEKKLDEFDTERVHTLLSMAVLRYCLMHSRSKMCLHLA